MSAGAGDGTRERVVAALGGNALLRRGVTPDATTQRATVRGAAASLAPIAREHDLVVTHGNGPQVGLLALQSEAYHQVEPYPLDVLGAESEGMIGYLIEQALAEHLPERKIATLLTQVEVDPEDDAFAAPSKPIGPVYTRERARALERARGWSVARDGADYRRVVPSPEPRRIRELATIQILLDAGVLVICVGGGGIPVVVTEGGGLVGTEAVIDKDLSAALLAEGVGASVLLLLTDRPAVLADWPTPARQAIRSAAPADLRAMTFEPGSMAPKVEGACRFVERTGGRAAIGALADAPRLLTGEVGTQVTTGADLRLHRVP